MSLSIKYILNSSFSIFSYLIFCSSDLSAQAIIGHRGGDALNFPENTLECVRDSFTKGVIGHELDIRTTLDGKLMILHDDTVNRTTNGTGSLSQLTSLEARSLDAGSWKGNQFSGTKIPFLDETLSLIKDNGTRAYLDIKHAAASRGCPKDR